MRPRQHENILEIAQEISDKADAWKGDPLPFWNMWATFTAPLAKALLAATAKVDQPTPPTRTGLHGLHGLLDKWSRQIIDTRIFRPQTPERDASIEQAVSMRDELQTAVQEMRCETCKHGRGMGAEPMMSDEPRCCHPSEAHPLHWQETSPGFGCFDWQPRTER